eukprot:TRINITY_DN28971_c0_g1_i1.p1 TRINITY_DN28971_c0_g1~~TRINITY_DN28971_c0_g1_i1.p1  ORF type:complete len:318 (-),score=59.30 TRINITY_DN28971_c0_g1_i1:25-978(-)
MGNACEGQSADATVCTDEHFSEREGCDLARNEGWFRYDCADNRDGRIPVARAAVDGELAAFNHGTNADCGLVDDGVQQRLSIKSAKALETLRLFEQRFDRISDSVLIIEAELKAGVTQPGYACDELAQLEAELDKIQCNGVDSIETSGLETGRDEARAKRKALTKRSESLHTVMDNLFSFAKELKRKTHDVGAKAKIQSKRFYVDATASFPLLTGEYVFDQATMLAGGPVWRMRGDKSCDGDDGSPVMYVNETGRCCIAPSESSALMKFSQICSGWPLEAGQEPWELTSWLSLSEEDRQFHPDLSVTVRLVEQEAAG